MLIALDRAISEDRKISDKDISALKPKNRFLLSHGQIQKQSGQYSVVALSPAYDTHVVCFCYPNIRNRRTIDTDLGELP